MKNVRPTTVAVVISDVYAGAPPVLCDSEQEVLQVSEYLTASGVDFAVFDRRHPSATPPGLAQAVADPTPDNEVECGSGE